jgi:predicted esterase
MTRRRFLGLASTAVAACGAAVQRDAVRDGHIVAPWHGPTSKVRPGELPLRLELDRDGLLIVPKNYRPEVPAALLTLLHGAGGWSRRLEALFPIADELGIVLLSPESRDRGTWDGITGRYGPDVDFLSRALKFTFDRCAIDPKRIAFGGFSDGASYALSAGLSTGDLFTHIIAFSPGFIIQGSGQRGKPRIFVSHGTADQILPIDSTSRRIVPALEKAGYPVVYREFNGPHRVPPEIATEAFKWLVGKPA